MLKMSRIQMLRLIVQQRLTAAAEEIFGVFEKTVEEYEEEIDRQRRLLAHVTNASEKADHPQLFDYKEEVPSEKQEWTANLGHEELETPNIKEEQEELWTNQEEEQLQRIEEADSTKLPFPPAPVKRENNEGKPHSSQLHQSQTEENKQAEPSASTSSEQMKTQPDGEDFVMSEPLSNLDQVGDLELINDGEPLPSDYCESETEDNDDDWNKTRETWSSLYAKDNEMCHQRSIKKKTFICSICGKGFTQRGDVLKHMRIHTGEKPFRGSVYGNAFSQRGDMLKHTRIHKGEKPFSCTICGKEFSQRGQIQLHIRTHTGEKPFSCSICGKGFSVRQNMKTHMRMHTGEKTFTCSQLKQFSRLSFEEKCQLLSDGRPTPDLQDLQQRKGQKTVRTFQTDWYERKDWLCGCATLKRLFCFPCLLFGSTTDKVWTNAGYCDLNNLSSAVAKHEKSVVHIQSQIALKTFGHKRIDLVLDEQQQLSISIHNEKVKKNREVLKCLIDSVCFLGKQELAFHGNNESASSSNQGSFTELLHLIASKNVNLAAHLVSSTVFSNMSNRIQNDLIESIADVLKEDITEELSVAQFVAVEVNETTYITNKAQLSVILRYVSGSEVKEAFLGFDDASDDRRTMAITNYVLGILEKFNCAHKLVAQTYDGASVMASHLNGVQAKIREKIPEVILTYCYGHKLSLVLSQSAKMIPECKMFFKTVEGLSVYFSESMKRTNLLDEVVKRRIPRAAATNWNSNLSHVQTIMFCHAELREVFNIIQENPDDWDGEALTMASGFNLWLSKASTCFLLMAYSAIFTETDALFRVLQTKVMDIGLCSLCVSDTVKALHNQRQLFDSFYECFLERCQAMNLVDNNMCSKQWVQDERRRLFYSILDNINVQMEARFKNLEELDFLALADCKKFNELSAHFDDAKLHSLAKYGKYFDFVRLKADLIGLYSSQMVKDKSPLQLLAFLVENDLEQTVPEATKLLKLMLTIPATTASVERSFSALKHIKTYSCNRMEQGRLSSLAFIAVEKERLIKLKAKTEEFYNAVINMFVKKDGRTDFIFK